ncbi:MAG: DUF5069 domain-containing protein [Verrucomicrobiota bacterium]
MKNRSVVDREPTGLQAPVISNLEAVKELALDLSGDFPRSPRALLGGYVVAGRALDKCRAVLAGTNDEYHFDCPLDNLFFDFTGISAEEMKAIVSTGLTDEAFAE